MPLIDIRQPKFTSAKVGIIMPAFNCEKYVAESIDSILNQSFTDFILIVIDDNSSDNTFHIIKFSKYSSVN